MVDAKGVSQEEVAKGTGIAEPIISEVLNNRCVLSHFHIDKIAKYFHVSPKVFNQEERMITYDNKAMLRGLKGLMDLLSDHHQEITLLAAELNNKLVEIAEGKSGPMYISAATTRADELMDLLESQAARCYRVKAEIAHMRKSIKVI
jgi:transcriptional regulator with XRE-family HTH domain